MLTDITLGQYIPADSPVHKLDPRIKIISVFLYIIAVFFANSPISYVFLFLGTTLVIKVSKIRFMTVIKSLKPLMFLIVFTAIINIFMSGTDDILWQWKFLRITATGLESAIVMALRLVFLVTGTSLLTYTTSPIMLTDGIERLLHPFSKIGLPAHELAMMMTIALRFIPTLLEETDKIIKAQKARGADFESGNVFKRAKALVPILVPLFVSSFRRADELAVAMECRCYRGGEGRTRLRELKIMGKDYVAILTVLVFCTVIVLLDIVDFSFLPISLIKKGI